MEEVDPALLMAPQEETEGKMEVMEAGPALLTEPQEPMADKELEDQAHLMELLEETVVKMAVLEEDQAHLMELPVLTVVKEARTAVMEEGPAHLMEHLDREVKVVREAVDQALHTAHQDKEDPRAHQAHHTAPQEQATVKDSVAVHLLHTALLVQGVLPAQNMVLPAQEETQATAVGPDPKTAAMG